MDGHACAEALRVCLVELCVRHRDRGLVLTCKRQDEYYRRKHKHIRRTDHLIRPSCMDTLSLSFSLALTDLLDAFLVLYQQLHSRDVYVQPGALGGALHRGVKAAVVFTDSEIEDKHTHIHSFEKIAKCGSVK